MMALISALFAALFGLSSSWFIALKVVLGLLFMTIMPIILKNFFNYLVAGVLSVVTAQAGGTTPFVVSLVGLAGYFASQIDLPGATSVVISAVALKYTLRMIPFVRL